MFEPSTRPRKDRHLLRSRIAGICTALAGFLACVPSGYAVEQWADCKPIEVMAWLNYVHVRCERPVALTDSQQTLIWWFAASNSADVRFANRMVALGTAAQIAQKTLTLRFETNDSSGPTFGCNLSNCRPVQVIGITEHMAPR